MLPGPVHRDRPEIGGFCFDETAGLDFKAINALAQTGHVFVTEFRARRHDGTPAQFGGTLIATDLGEAVEEAARRGLGETVLGVLHCVGNA